jgi:hypothetical protein
MKFFVLRKTHEREMFQQRIILKTMLVVILFHFSDDQLKQFKKIFAEADVGLEEAYLSTVSLHPLHPQSIQKNKFPGS